jgi:uncharacterized protein
MFRSKAVAAAFVLAAALVPWPAPAAAPATCPTPPAADANLRVVVVRTPTSPLLLRVVKDPETREYGLMCVRTLPPRTGMIFVFPGDDRPQSFWMKNTLISLDMVWVGRDGRVNEVAANVPSTTVDTPDDKIPTRVGTGTYVIELGAGDAEREGIKTGVQLDVSGVGTTKN